MAYFELCWSWYEDYDPHIFFHPTKTHTEFTEDVKKLLINYGPDYIAQETSWVGASGWIQFIVPHFIELGYERVIPSSIFNVFGAYIIEGDGEDDKNFKNIIGENLYKQVLDHNKKLREHVNKEYDHRSSTKKSAKPITKRINKTTKKKIIKKKLQG